ncbi:MAG: hypothetical protein K9M15_00485 [Candidatus Marinimicrobia bacterium]|nr:hypothetical protein [Candidatus Neomarinimicrobiota bacterium]
MKETGHIIETQSFERAWIETKFFKEVEDMSIILKNNPSSLLGVLKSKKILLLFWKKSVRTSDTFHLTADMLGANTHLIEGEKQLEKWQIPYSSEVESGCFEDMIRTFATRYDCIVIRHPEEGLASRAATLVDRFNYKTKIINAGDGPGQHPIQALIDIYSIHKNFGKIDGLTCTLMGDLLNSRAIHSLVYLLGKFNVKMFLVSPSKLKMPKGITSYLNRHSVSYEEIHPSEMNNIKKSFDFMYVVRIPNKYPKDSDIMHSITNEPLPVINKGFAEDFLKKHSKVYHPFSRGLEITPWRDDDKKSQKESIDEMPCAGYFEQIENGTAVISAVLKMALNPASDLKEIDDNWKFLGKK